MRRFAIYSSDSDDNSKDDTSSSIINKNISEPDVFHQVIVREEHVEVPVNDDTSIDAISEPDNIVQDTLELNQEDDNSSDDPSPTSSFGLKFEIPKNKLILKEERTHCVPQQWSLLCFL